MNIQMNVTGTIGSKLTLNTSYNNNSNFVVDQRIIKVQYNPSAGGFSEDEIIQDIQMGNVALPLRSNLIQGSQGLFGVRLDMKFGHLKLTSLVSMQQTRRDEIQIQNGAQVQDSRCVQMSTMKTGTSCSAITTGRNLSPP
jgi:hypothetical protein